MVSDTSDIRIQKHLEGNLSKLFDKKDDFEIKKRVAEQKLKTLSNEKKDTEIKLEDLKKLFSFMESKEGDELIDLRFNIRTKLRDLIEAIIVYPVGYTSEYIKKNIEALPLIEPGISENMILYMENHFKSKMNDKKFRSFMIVFSTGVVRAVEPMTDLPFTFEIDPKKGTMVTQYEDTICEWVMKGPRIWNTLFQSP
jgi:hypothetical protein